MNTERIAPINIERVKVSKKTGYVTVLYIEAGQMKQVVVTGADIVRNFFEVQELREKLKKKPLIWIPPPGLGE